MIGRWNAEGKGLTAKVMGRVRPGAPLKNRIGDAREKLRLQIEKLDRIHANLQKSHDSLFGKIVEAQRRNDTAYARVFATELHEIKKMKFMINNAKVSLMQVQMRLDTVSELGDVVVTLSPCMSVIKGLGKSLEGVMPAAAVSMQDLTEVLGGVLGSSTMDVLPAQKEVVSTGAQSILDDAQAVLAERARVSIPDIVPPSGAASADTNPDIPDIMREGRARRRVRTGELI